MVLLGLVPLHHAHTLPFVDRPNRMARLPTVPRNGRACTAPNSLSPVPPLSQKATIATRAAQSQVVCRKALQAELMPVIKKKAVSGLLHEVAVRRKWDAKGVKG